MKKNIRKSVVLFCMVLLAIGGIGFCIDHYREAREAVQVVSERVLIPGGQSVGIKMNVKGVLVVGLEEIETADGIVSPGYAAGLQIGDIITKIDGAAVSYAAEVSDIIRTAGARDLSMEVMRKEEKLTLTVRPVKDTLSDSYKIGLWVKEKIAGIGTLTFYDPRTNTFAALGHGIYESQTGTLLGAGEGQLLPTEVKSIKEGTVGKPGEIRGVFYGSEKPFGMVKKNSSFGIYAKGTSLEAFSDAEPIVMGHREQVEKGKAYILTTIDGDRVEKFDIEINKVNRQDEPDSKSMEITVTDSRLLAYSGGIVQGMSGSPIIQNNRLIGAVTHVFVNDPTKGYAIFADWMVSECDSL